MFPPSSLSIYVHFKCDPCPPLTYVRSSELPHPLSKMIMFLHRDIYAITIKIFTSHKKKLEKMEIGLTPLLFVRFRLLFKRTRNAILNPSPPPHPLPHCLPPRWTICLKKIREIYRRKEKKIRKRWKEFMIMLVHSCI